MLRDYIDNDVELGKQKIKFEDVEEFLKDLDQGLTNTEFKEFFDDLKNQDSKIL